MAKKNAKTTTVKKKNPSPKNTPDPKNSVSGNNEDPTNDTSTDEKDVVELSSTEYKIALLIDEKDKLNERMLRQAAEFDNYKKRHATELERIISTASEYLIRDLLPVLDDIDLMLANAESGNNTKSLVEGAKMIRQKLYGVLIQRGLEKIEAEGQPFDPDYHEALLEQPSTDVEPGTVIGVHQNGFTLKGKLIRPSKVIISKTPDEGTGEL
ncbi:MAG: nucleotide exchange factor GrpE [Candidatus Electryonea clarkiae]|nr:nucleotide exchange factor GrpE [Candidatus Electryonea clarkiae]MDP8285930.1 nucleotide exchange factor GrpE [Candidatus Electryonea clarkiae]